MNKFNFTKSSVDCIYVSFHHQLVKNSIWEMLK